MDLETQKKILENVYVSRIDPVVLRRFYLAELNDYERNLQAQAWYDEVIRPLNADISQDEAKKVFFMEISNEEFIKTLNESQLDAFLDKFADLQNQFQENHKDWWE